ncbi:aldo/keto reductase, partial [Oleiphilus sp. HI0117]
SIQNEFNLLHTKDWPYLIENCVHQDVAYLPWSPLGGGVLSGKYLNGERPDGSRWSIPQRNGILRDKPNVETAVSAYASIAKQLDITPAQLALAWCNQVDGVTSTIIGATSLQQLEEDIEAFKVELSKDDLKAIFKVLREYPLPF